MHFQLQWITLACCWKKTKESSNITKSKKKKKQQRRRCNLKLIITLIRTVLCNIIDSYLQMLSRLYQKQCLQTWEIWGVCESTEAHYATNLLHLFSPYGHNKPELHPKSINYFNFTHCFVFSVRDLSSNAIKSLPVGVFANLTELSDL